jgi:hypothetical protein
MSKRPISDHTAATGEQKKRKRDTAPRVATPRRGISALVPLGCRVELDHQKLELVSKVP